MQDGITKDRMRGSCPKKNGKDRIPLRECGVLCLLCIASMSEKYKAGHHFPHTALASLRTSFTLDFRVTNPATQQTWRACVGQLQWRKGMPPNPQRTLRVGGGPLCTSGLPQGALRWGWGGKKPSFFKQLDAGSKWILSWFLGSL